MWELVFGLAEDGSVWQNVESTPSVDEQHCPVPA
jgi:hypothetical protein